jgi:hypothetical protein
MRQKFRYSSLLLLLLLLLVDPHDGRVSLCQQATTDASSLPQRQR